MSKIEKQKEVISITHFINPHLFWYHKVDLCNDDYRNILEIEKELAQYYIDHQAWTQALRHPPINSTVAVKFLAWNKMIRARVDHIAGFGKNVAGGEFIMWAIDYGFPFQTKADHIYRLPEKLTTPVDYIHCGGLVNILPAEHFFMKNTMVKRVTNKWHQRACDVVEKAINDSECIVFVKDYTENGQEWGELIVKTNMGVKYRIKDHLISLHLGIDAETSSFHKQCKKLETIKILPWMCNSGNSKFHTNRVFLFPGVIGGMTQNGIKLAALECIEAKQKVEEWYERCENTAGNDAGFLDTTSEYTMTEGSIIDAMSVRKLDQQYETDLTKIDEDEEIQHIQLAGVLTKSRMERFSRGKLQAPRLPNNLDFEMRSESAKANQTIETTDSEISSIKFVPLQDSTLHNIDAVVQQPAEQCVKSGHDETIRSTECDLVLKKIKEIKDHEEDIVLKSEEIGLYAEYLITLRNKYIEAKADEELSDSTLNEDIDIYRNNNFNNDKHFKFPTVTKTNRDMHEPQDSINKTFYGLRMIPAGYDIMNLNGYNDEKHWHRKKSTLNDHVPHNDMDLLNYAK